MEVNVCGKIGENIKKKCTPVLKDTNGAKLNLV